jgi:hypothetical protein
MPNLSAVAVRNAKPEKKPYKIADGKGLYFHIAPSGKKTWRYRFEIAGKESTIVLGTYPEMSLEAARDARFQARKIVKEGKNPAHIRKEKRYADLAEAEAARQINKNTLEFVAKEWLERQVDRWSHNHFTAVENSLKNNVYPIIGGYPVGSITPPMIMQVITPIENRGSLEIASKILQRITAIFRYAVQSGKATYNPAGEMRGVLKTRKVNHRAALTIDDLPQFLRKLSTADIHITNKVRLCEERTTI